MSDKKKVYVETSVISNLTARPSSRVVEAGRQIATIEWWERATQEYELYGHSLLNVRLQEVMRRLLRGGWKNFGI